MQVDVLVGLSVLGQCLWLALLGTQVPSWRKEPCAKGSLMVTASHGPRPLLTFHVCVPPPAEKLFCQDLLSHRPELCCSITWDVGGVGPRSQHAGDPWPQLLAQRALCASYISVLGAAARPCGGRGPLGRSCGKTCLRCQAMPLSSEEATRGLGLQAPLTSDLPSLADPRRGSQPRRP